MSRKRPPKHKRTPVVKSPQVKHPNARPTRPLTQRRLPYRKV